ncbi:hypothetical protein CYMTET_53288 [Cymbomonas tetramitiformis]|uniref:F-box domain-containing protein n=1 Tax=Cymbomonas tetramitiformis TaxID=36881 RepID=A0AAE0BIF8_9CHLO|nr:hypothetical protein CYMTET_53288 [Cymbomonas tetramitiformis]
MNSLSNEVFCHDGDDDWELVTESTNAPLEPWEDVCAVVPFENNGEVAYAGKVKSGTGVLSTICLWNTENKDYLTLLPTAVVLRIVGFLPPEDVVRGSAVCSTWRRALSVDCIWSPICEGLMTCEQLQKLPSGRTWFDHYSAFQRCLMRSKTTNSVGSTEVCRSTKQKATKHKVFRSKKERRMERISKDTTPLTTFLAAKCQG